MVDRSFGQFRVGPVLGQGSFGTVYLGTHLQTGELAALKVEDIGSSNLLKHEVSPPLHEGAAGEPAADSLSARARTGVRRPNSTS